MDSTQLKQYGKQFSPWYPFNKQIIKNVPEDTGVYIIRKVGGQRFGRLRGESDILYIGSATSQGGLKQRLQQYFSPGPTQWTNKRINEFAKKYSMEVAWCLLNEPKNFEDELLRQYLKEHDELPPFNYASIRTLHKNFTDEGKGTDSFVVEKRES
jgi:excinuclease UvrABC nuclease subunit